MAIGLDVLVLPAFDDIDGLPGEVEPWEQAYDFKYELQISGVSTPLRYTNSGVGLVRTGIGKAAAATTVTALLTSDQIRVDDTLILSVGVAGGPPTLDIGSVVVADSIVDWDHKCRIDAGDSEEIPLAMNPYTGGMVFDLSAERTNWALDVATDVSLSADGDTRNPRVVSGTNLCGDELWHGEQLVEQVEWLVDELDAGPYHATEMEDAGTAFALNRLGYLDQYVCVRGISNYDRPLGDNTAKDNLFSPTFEDGFETGIDNAVRVARRLIDTRL